MTKKTKKTIILALLLCIISINSANSESPFRLIYKPDKLSHSVNQSFLQIFSGPSHTGSSLTHFPYQEDYKVFDKYGNMRVYNAFSTGLDGHWGATFYDFIRTMGTSFTSGGLFVLRHKSFFFIEQPTTNPQFTNHFVEWDLAEIVEPPDIWHQSMLRGFNVIADNNFETHYFYTTDAFLYKVKIDEPDKVVAKYAFNPTPAVSFPFANYKPILYHIYSGGTKRELWFVTHQTPTEIFRFDLITEEFTKYDGSNLPINISSIHSDLYPDEDPGYKIRNYFLCSDEKGNPFPVFVTYKAEKLSNGEYSFDNALLYYKYDYENHIWNWDTARIDFCSSLNPKLHIIFI